MKDENNNKKTVNAGQLLQKLKPYLQDENIVSKQEEYSKDGKGKGFEEESFEGSNTDIVEANAQLPEQNEEQYANGEIDPEFAEYLANEARMLHGNMDDEDFDLMSIFGVEDGKEDDGEFEEEEKKEKKKIKEIDFSRQSQVKRAERQYNKRYALSLAGIVGTTLLLIFSLVCEGALALGLRLPAMLDVEHYPQIALLVSVQILVLAVSFQYKLFTRSIKQLFTGKADSGVIFALYSVILLIYYLGMLVFGVKDAVVTYNTVLVLAALFSLVDELFSSDNAATCLKTAGRQGLKHVLVELDKKHSRDARELVGRYLSPNTSYFTVKEAMRVNDFNKRMSDKSTLRRVTPVMMLLSAVISAVLGVLALYKAGAQTGLHFAISAFLMLMPLPLCIIFSHPAYSRNRRLAKSGATVVGERSFEQYKTPACLVIEDKYIFADEGGVHLIGLNGHGEIGVDTAIGYAAAVFTRLDCPLGAVFANTASDYRVSTDVDIAFIDDDGIEAAVEGSSVLIGSADYLRAHRIDPSLDDHKDPDDDESSLDGYDQRYNGMFDVYIAVDKKNVFRITVQYVPSKEFVKTVKTLIKKDVNVVIKTCDPNINMEMLEILTGINSVMPVRILRIKDAEKAKYSFSEECSGGIISDSGISCLAETFSGSAKVSFAMRAGAFFCVLAFVVAAALLFILSASTGYAGFASIVIAAYQLVWMLPVFLLDKLLL